MSQITIRNMDPLVEKIIRQRAEDRHQSLSETVNQMLKQAAGLDSSDSRKRNLKSLAGSWSLKDGEEFDKSQEPFSQIDEEIWK